MDSKTVAVGIFVLKDRAYINSMPVYNASGFWHAWKMPDELFMIQPLDEDHLPWGTLYPLEAREFIHLLSPWRDTETAAESDASSIARETARKSERPADPLALWYHQALEDQHTLETQPSPPLSPKPAPAEPQKSRKAAAPARTAVSRDETRLVPLWHPDALLDNERVRTPVPPVPGHVPHVPQTLKTRPAPEPAPRKEEDELFRGFASAEAVTGPRPADFLPFASLEEAWKRSPAAAKRQPPSPQVPLPRQYGAGVTVETMSKLAAKTSTLPDQAGYQAPAARSYDAAGTEDADAAQASAGQREHRMRDAFASLMEQYETHPSAALEQAVARLLQREGAFTPQQKYMFSEFGVTLRRKHLPALALDCHMRALELAPADECVLFNVARSKFDLGDPDAARRYLAAALLISPDFAPARHFLSFLEGDN